MHAHQNQKYLTRKVIYFQNFNDDKYLQAKFYMMYYGHLNNKALLAPLLDTILDNILDTIFHEEARGPQAQG